jgi:hypothetical protein
LIAQFVQEHLNDDTARLILDRAKWPEIDIDLAVNCIESRRKLKGKVQEWYDNPELIFPLKLSAEQCSSSSTGAYKAAFAKTIYERCITVEGTQRGMRIADLTGGYGVDSWSFSKVADKVLYCEMLSVMCDAARDNFAALGSTNIQVENITVSPSHHDSSCHPERSEGSSLLATFQPDIIYLDPARRSETGKKVFLIEECTPDVLTLKDELFTQSRNILLKLSPMADITMVCERLGRCCREVYVVAMGGECKELLIWMDREWSDEYTITAVELPSHLDSIYHREHSESISEASETDVKATFCFTPSDEKAAQTSIATKEDITQANFLFEPGKALMKAGAFNTLCHRFGLKKLGRSTHYYIIGKEELVSGLGKTYQIISQGPLDKRSIKAAGAAYPKSEVTARNIPMDTDTLRKKLGITSGDDAHIFGLKSDTAGNLLFITRRF